MNVKITMTLRICICCGEPMAECANTLSRNPNMCASCSSLADGMKESGLHTPLQATSPKAVSPPGPPAVVPTAPEAAVLQCGPQEGPESNAAEGGSVKTKVSSSSL
jgi:hypothetical protein